MISIIMSTENGLDINLRPETIKLLEENIGRTPVVINCIKILYDPPPKVIEIEIKQKETN